MQNETQQTRAFQQRVTLAGALLITLGIIPGWSLAQTAAKPDTSSSPSAPAKTHTHRPAKKSSQAVPVVEAPPPPPAPHWPINDSPNPPSIAWNSSGLKISASNSSLQQILNEVSTDTGTRIIGSVPDQRVFGNYGPGDAREVLSQLLQGSGFNVLLAGDIGKGAPSEVVLTPRRSGGGNTPNSMNRPQQQDPDEDIPDQPEEEPQPQVQQMQQPPTPPETRPGAGGPNGPMRTPQQVMEEMQQRQLLQQQQMQQQQQQNPQQ